MTNSQKAAIEEAAKEEFKYCHRSIDEVHYRFGFQLGAQHVIDHPGEFGLIDREWKEDAIHNADTGVEIAAERDRYREALESVDEDLVFLEDCAHHAEGDIATIARKKIEEALKQQ